MFRTLLVAAIKIKAKLSLVDLRLQQKYDKYAIKLLILQMFLLEAFCSSIESVKTSNVSKELFDKKTYL
jgi:hypothetical protein